MGGKEREGKGREGERKRKGWEGGREGQGKGKGVSLDGWGLANPILA